MDQPSDEIAGSTPSYRGLKAVVIILGVLILAAFIALAVGLINKLGAGPADAGGKRPYLADIAADPDATIVYSQLQDRRLLLRLKTPAGEEIVILDADTGRVIGRVRVKPAVPSRQ